jgi:hypothetical protein
MKCISGVLGLLAIVLSFFISPCEANTSIDTGIRITVLGLVNKPFPTIWIVRAPFVRPQLDPVIKPFMEFDKFVILRATEYRLAQTFTSTYSCSPYRHTKYLERFEPVEVTSFNQGRVLARCLFSREHGCEYISQLRSLPGVDWSSEDRRVAMRDLSDSIRCNKL